MKDFCEKPSACGAAKKKLVARQEREAAALRANLKKRKSQKEAWKQAKQEKDFI